jgi:hypothetical protein
MNRTTAFRMPACDRAREASSVRADGELSEVEGAMLDRHLAACGSCAEFDARLRAMADMMRSAAAEKPSRSFAVPPTETARLPARRRAVIAAAAAAVVAGMLAGVVVEAPQRPAPPAPPEIALVPYESEGGRIRPDPGRDVNKAPVLRTPRVDRV